MLYPGCAFAFRPTSLRALTLFLNRRRLSTWPLRCLTPPKMISALLTFCMCLVLSARWPTVWFGVARFSPVAYLGFSMCPFEPCSMSCVFCTIFAHFLFRCAARRCLVAFRVCDFLWVARPQFPICICAPYCHMSFRYSSYCSCASVQFCWSWTAYPLLGAYFCR